MLYLNTKESFYVVYTGIGAGCYSCSDEAYEASWHSDEPVGLFSSLARAKSSYVRFLTSDKLKK
tara:strand:+ start:7218 stop:7409 length:192 start_codon:yes stop_codon:yes gene_type:complete